MTTCKLEEREVRARTRFGSLQKVVEGKMRFKAKAVSSQLSKYVSQSIRRLKERNDGATTEIGRLVS